MVFILKISPPETSGKTNFTTLHKWAQLKKKKKSLLDLIGVFWPKTDDWVATNDQIYNTKLDCNTIRSVTQSLLATTCKPDRELLPWLMDTCFQDSVTSSKDHFDSLVS